MGDKRRPSCITLSASPRKDLPTAAGQRCSGRRNQVVTDALQNYTLGRVGCVARLVERVELAVHEQAGAVSLVVVPRVIPAGKQMDVRSRLILRQQSRLWAAPGVDAHHLA